MIATSRTPPVALVLGAATAREMMTANPVSLPEQATIQEALVLLVDRGIHAAPVIDDAGRPIGVLSSTDILIHDRESVTHVPRLPEFYTHTDLALDSGEQLPRGFHVERVDRTRVRDIMTPTVFAIAPDAPAASVVNEMLTRRVHRLFVVDNSGVLIGVISTFDVLRRLRPE
jgi:CBS domain-containing protein